MASLSSYANGAIPLELLSEVEPGIYLRPGVAVHYQRAIAKFLRLTGHRAWSSEGFRPLGAPGDWPGRANTQWYYYERKRAIPSSPSAAYPGGSMHGWGKATDIHSGSYNNNSGSTLYTILKRCLEEEGFVCDVPGEPWHFNYYGSDADWAGADPTPFTEEEDMTPEQDKRLSNVENLVSLIAKQKPGAIWVKNIDLPGAFALLTEGGKVTYPKSSQEIETINRVMGGAPGVKREADPLNNQEYTDIISIWTR